MKHLETGLLFRDREDYIAGWNRLVVCQQKTEIIIYAFALMSNHFHLLMRGSSDTAKAFFEHYRKTTSMYMQSKYGLTEFGKSVQIGAVVPITDPDMFRTEIAYILRNPYKAGIGNPFTYEWSSAIVYFNPFYQSITGVPIRRISIEKQRALMRSRMLLPDTFELIDGKIGIKSFVDYQFVEDIFEGSVQLFDAVRNWNTERESLRLRDGNEYNAYDDQVIQARMTLLLKEFGIEDWDGRDPVQTRLMVRAMRSRLGCSQKQIVRVAAIPEDQVRKYF